MPPDLLTEIKEALIFGKYDTVEKKVNEALKKKVPPMKILNEALIEGMKEVGRKWIDGEVFLADVMMSAEAMRKGMNLIEPLISKPGKERKIKGKVLIATIYTDIHDIGKKIVAALLQAEGYEVIDLGVDVPPSKIIEEALKNKVDLIGVSCLLTTSILYIKDLIDFLSTRKLRNKFIVAVGGAALTKDKSEEIGADLYAETAEEAIKEINEKIKEFKARGKEGND